ncbi:MAG: transcription termination factor Rho [Chthoniobacterales bacterium]
MLEENIPPSPEGSESHLPSGSAENIPPQPPAEEPQRLILKLGDRVIEDKIAMADLHAATLHQLIELGRAARIRFTQERSRHHITLDIVRYLLGHGIPIRVEGMLDLTNDAYGLLRWARYSFQPCPEDIYVSLQLIKRHSLRAGNKISGWIRPSRDKEKYVALEIIDAIEDIPADDWKETKFFDNLTPLFPDKRIILENETTKSVTARVIDLISPLGRGQRALIVAPPRAGKTIMLKEIAKAIRVTAPEIHLILLLVDERPEEVTDFQQTVDAEIYSSTFDENAQRHTQVADLVIERAKRLVELGQHVVIMLDSITRLARGYNNLQPGKGRTMSGGIDAAALMKPRRFFGAARNVEEGGSLTIVATALVETGSRMDDAIFEEFKGTGNMELHLDRALVEKRVYPAIHVLKSGTRRDELLYHPEEFMRIGTIRKQLASIPPIEAMEVLIANVKATKTNAELLLRSFR